MSPHLIAGGPWARGQVRSSGQLLDQWVDLRQVVGVTYDGSAAQLYLEGPGCAYTLEGCDEAARDVVVDAVVEATSPRAVSAPEAVVSPSLSGSSAAART